MATPPQNTQSGQERFQGVMAPLNIPDFQKLISSNFLWWANRFMEVIVVGWIVLELTDSAWQVAVVGFYRSAPFLFIGFMSGPVIDRFGRRTVIVWAQGIGALVAIVITGLLWADKLAFWHLAVGAVIVGTTWSLDWPARRSFMPDLVGKSKTVDAMLMENFAQNIARIVGPLLGGMLIDGFGPAGGYTGLALTATFSFLILLRLSRRPLPRTGQPGTSAWANVTEGLSYIRHSQPIVAVMLMTVIMNFLVFPYVTLLPVFARDVLHQGPTGLGILGAAPGVGAFVGLYIINQLRPRVSQGWIFAAGSFFKVIMLIAFSVSNIFILSVTLLLLAGVGRPFFGTMQSSIILLAASDEMRSRAMGILVLAVGAGPLGQLNLGGMAETFGAPLSVRLQALVAAVAIIGVVVSFPGFRQRLVEQDTAPTSAR